MSQFKYIFFNLSENPQKDLLEKEEDVSKQDFLKRLFSQQITFEYRKSTYAFRPLKRFNPIMASDGIDEHEFVVGRIGKQRNIEITELDEDDFISYSTTDWKASWFILCTSSNRQTVAIEGVTNINLKNLCDCLQNELVDRAMADGNSWASRYFVDVQFLRDLGSFWGFVDANKTDIWKVVFSFLRPNRQILGKAGEYKDLLGEWHKETPVEKHEVSLKLAGNLKSKEGSMTNEFVDLVEDGGANVSLFNKNGRKVYDARKNKADAPAKTLTIEEEDARRAITSEAGLRTIILALFMRLRRDGGEE